MPKVSEAHREERRRQILDGARAAFAEYGYEGATVARLEEAIGLSRGAIFSYYPTKWDVFYALATADMQQAGTRWVAEGVEGIVRYIGTQDTDWLAVYLEIGRMLRTDAAVRAAWEVRDPGMQERVGASIAAGQADGTYRADVPVESIGAFVGLLVDGLALHRAAGYEVDVESLLVLLRSALAPK